MIEIYALGNWDIRKDGVSILAPRGYQQRLLRLFKYLLIFEGQRITPEKMIEDLFPNEDYYNPKNTLRTQISRVRHMFGDSNFYNINYTNGYYVFEIDENIIIDYKEFENLLNRAQTHIYEEPGTAVKFLAEGLDMYKGELFNTISDYWIMPLRIRYKRLYKEGMDYYLEFLKEQKNFELILELTQKAIKYDPYDETFNAYFMKSLVNLNQKRYALNHYDYFTTKLSDELNLERFNRLYGNKTIDEDEANIKSNYFVLAKIKRMDNSIHVINSEEHNHILEKTLRKNLRKNDILSQCQKGYILLLLYNASYNDIQAIGKRIEKKIQEAVANPKLNLEIRAQKI